MKTDEAIQVVAEAVEVIEPLSAQNARLITALRAIADADYRGNRSPESVSAYRVLEAEGLQADPRTPKGTE